jgi:transglutaminase-like putative cysteine protease
MKVETATDYLNQVTLRRLMLVLALVLSVHLPKLPSWESALIVAGLGWRLLISLRQWSLPARWLRTLIAVVIFICVYISYGRINGQQPGTALIVAMAVLKLLEMRSRRDVMVTVFLMYFILLTHFLSSQEIWTAAYLLVCTSAITALLVDVNHPGEPLPLRVILRRGATMTVMAVPLMVVFFILFPRIPGPIWGLPSDAGAGLTGMSNEMSPGDISNLILSDKLAFRVRFLDRTPPPQDRYWRGPVFDSYNGRAWRASGLSQSIRPPGLQLLSPALRYEVIMEPHRGPWLFALDAPDPASLPPRSFLASEMQLMRGGDVLERDLYVLSSHTRYAMQMQPSRTVLRINTTLPAGFNPRTVALAERLRASNETPEQLIQSVLRMFREDPYVYTLRPPALGRESIDEFLFDTRRGFCEHYSSAFTFLMRAAGVPARVVTGYLGGEKNTFGDYYTVRSADAHAWSEVWLAGKGWVRIDPTAAVAPSRIEGGLSEAMGEELPGFLRRDGLGWIRMQLSAPWDWMNTQWNRWFLAYGPDVQLDLLGRIGIHDWQRMILALTIITTVTLSIIGLLLLRQFAPARNREVAVKLWTQLQKRLLRAGIAQRPAEGASDFAERVGLETPELGEAVRRAAAAYQQLRYLEGASPAVQEELAQAIKAIRT